MLGGWRVQAYRESPDRQIGSVCLTVQAWERPDLCMEFKVK